ncbi:carbohydrate sulfotransferase 15 [Aplysia californica]|uniref:Carbohydrate sulfotransferase 15 n=1 Tax=Aplysia californica TaxID=6500 RepID=A0ABM0ZXE0_APLCA|nr:carbohydrate sulfotransferase 15 [Aplysia californica]
MRDPVSRLFSRYLTWIGKVPGDEAYEFPSSENFHVKCKNAIDVYENCFRKHSQRQCAYSGDLYSQVKLRLQESMYSIFIKDWMKVFPKNQILFLRFEDYVKDIPGTLKKVFSFLELHPLNKEQLDAIVRKKVSNSGKHYKEVPAMMNKTRKMLQKFYRPWVKELQSILGNEFSWDY